jgi:hypothetical protein
MTTIVAILLGIERLLLTAAPRLATLRAGRARGSQRFVDPTRATRGGACSKGTAN